MRTYGPEPRAIWYLNDQSRRDRLANATKALGTVAVTAAKDGDAKVNLTITPSITQGTVQGYEVFRNNEQPIAFVLANGISSVSFTDEIGSGNNRSYTYTVKAYDTLGYLIHTAASQEISISYDLLVESGAYQLSRGEDGTVQIHFNRPTAVSGLKLPLANLGTGDFQITVIDETGIPAVARTGNFTATPSQTSDPAYYITYLHAKDAPAGDDQIWTYQAKAITITGIPADVSDADIQLISYAGDSIEFYNSDEGPTMGRLAEDFHYGAGVIPKDTLVIAGRFRGDPVYNTVRIMGKIPASDMAAEPGDNLPDGAAFALEGEVILFVNEQANGVYTTVYDGIFLFVPKAQEEAAPEGGTACGGVNVLPSLIRAELWRTDEPNGSTGTRLTAQTMWIASPGGEELPLMVIKGGNS